MASLVETLQSQQHRLLQPSHSLNESALGLAKQYLDAVGADINTVQKQRQEQLRKRKKNLVYEKSRKLHGIDQLYMEGFAVDQIWQQAKRVLDVSISMTSEWVNENDRALDKEEDYLVKRRKIGDEQEKDTNDINSHEQSLSEEDVGSELVEDDPGFSSDEDSSSLHSQEDTPLETDGSDDALDTDDQVPLEDTSTPKNRHEEFIRDKHGLNDGFFSIDRFNRNTQFLESVDARGEDDDGAASDEEEIDWGADPLVKGANIALGETKPRPMADEENSDQDEDEEAGPTFGNADLDASDTDESDGEDPLMSGNAPGEFSNTNEIMYDDFFAPPAGSKRTKMTRLDMKPSRRGLKTENATDRNVEKLAREEDDDIDSDGAADVQRAISSVKRDLDEDVDELGSAAEPVAAEDEREYEQNMSTHERRMVVFRKEIAKLEKENVSKKPWALTGETVAAARPENALLEEDMDFERAGKPLPVPTQEVNESIEELVKRRILHNEFDEVLRRRPELNDGSKPGRRGLTNTQGELDELSNSKPQKGLAQEYEDEHLRRTDPNFVDQGSEALKKKHMEIEKQWAGLQSQLDALCNWHYKPRPVTENLEVRTDAAVVRMEEARPTADTAGNISGLAPQEVYRPGRSERTPGEVLTNGGTAVSKEEETRENKRRRRRRAKERAQKSGSNFDKQDNEQKQGNTAAKKADLKKRDHRDIAKTLQDGNVKIIGKKGEVQDFDRKGTSTNAHSVKTGAAVFML